MSSNTGSKRMQNVPPTGNCAQDRVMKTSISGDEICVKQSHRGESRGRQSGWIAGYISMRSIAIMPKLNKSRPTSAALTLVIVFISLNLAPIELAQSQCLERTMTSFERIAGVMIKDAPLTILYQANMSQATIGHHLAQNNSLGSSANGGGGGTGITATLYQISTPITAECNNRCRKNKSCRAFLVDYGRHTCWSVDSHPPVMQAQAGSQAQQLAFNLLERAPTPIHLIPTGERSAYFEKVCLNLPTVECERAWNFERVLAHHIHGHDDKIIDNVPSRLKCQEHCLNERQFRCRSGEYDNLSEQCRLSLVDRHMKPTLFRPTSSNVDYFENQCAPSANQCDSFERFEDMDLGRAEIMRLANSSEQCQHFCTHTIKAFVCRSFTWSPLTGRCYLNSANTFMVGGTDKLLPAPGLIYYQRNDCIDLKLECDTNSMTLNLRTNEPFRGRMYVRDDPNACETMGRSALHSSLNIPFHSALGARCAQREMPSRYSSVVVVQQHPLIQRKSDRYIKLVCDFQTSNKTITSHYNVMANPWTSTALINATSFAPKILLRITDKFGNDITGAKLGDELQLRIEAETDSIYDMVARSVLAKSGTTDESIVLIDRDGCPADFRIFPPLKKLNKRTIIGRFDAFKFSSDVVVRFQVDVQFCLNSCPPTNCLDQQQQQQQQQQQALFNVNPQTLATSNPSGSELTSQAALEGPTSSLYSTTASSSTTTSTPSLAASGERDPVEPLSEYTRATTSAPANSRQQDYLSTLNANSLSDYQNSLGPAGQRHQAPAANQPLANKYSNSNNNNNNNNIGQQPTSDQLFDPAQARLMGASEGLPTSGKHHKLPVNKQRPSYENNAMHLQQVDQLSGAELAAALNQAEQQQDQNSHASRRRRRRSTEPMPASPKHVPLQREIIVIESPAQANKQAADKDKSARNSIQTGAQRSQRDMKAAGSRKQQQQQQQEAPIEGSKYELNLSDQQASNSRAPNLAELDDTKTQLLCTTRTSLVFSMLAFGALQMLTLSICFAGWLHKRRANKLPNNSFGTSPKHHQRQAQQPAQQQNFPTARLQANLVHPQQVHAGRSGRFC